MNKTRMIRVNEEIKKEISDVINFELKDPRMVSMTTVTRVDTTNDLKHCKVFVSVLGDATQKKDTLEGLNSAISFIKRQLATKLNLRNTPNLKFILDESVEYSIHIAKLIDKVNGR